MCDMTLLSINNISKSYASVKVLKGVNLDIMPGDKIALIGDNGAGKTTLLRLISGSENPDPEFGSIQLARGTVVGYMEQQLEQLSANSSFALEDPEFSALEQEIFDLQAELESCDNEDRVDQLMQKYARAQDRFEAMGGFDFRRQLEATLSAFSLDETTIRRPLEYLSGGERMRVALARLLLRSPDLLLLDEPTNHLDQKAIDWLEDYLSKTASAVLFVSHDRTFINNVASRIAELNAARIRIYSGNYTKYLEQKALEEKTLERRIYQTEKKLHRQEEITQTMLSHRKIAQYHSSEKKEKRIGNELTALRAFKRSAHKRMSFKLAQELAPSSSRRDQIAIKAEDLTVHFEGESDAIFSNLSLTLIRGKHIALVGKNGCGKTTLLKTLMGQIPQNKGVVSTAANLTFGFLGQEANFDDYEKTVLEQLLFMQPQLNDAEARSELARFGFSGDTVFQKTGSLSGGERSRLFLCALLQDKPDVLFMDEPTNHLDIYSRELLEDALNEFPGTILAVSHDRYFVDQIAEEVWAMLDDGISIFPDMSAYKDAEKEADRKRAESRKSNQTGSLFEKMEKTAAGEIPPKMPVWDKEAIRLYPDLAKLKQYPRSKSDRRRVVADINQVFRNLESNLSRHHEEKSSLEKKFTRVESDEIYHDYAELLLTIEIEELLYLQLMEIAEEFKG